MLHHPDVMKHCQAEIDDVLGKKSPSMKDKTSMPYVEATLLELQRMVSVGLFGVNILQISLRPKYPKTDCKNVSLQPLKNRACRIYRKKSLFLI